LITVVSVFLRQASVEANNDQQQQCENAIQDLRMQFEENKRILKGLECCEHFSVRGRGYCWDPKKRTREEADKYCGTMNATVAHIGVRTAAERGHVMRELKAHSAYWVGLEYNKEEKIWSWLDGTEVTSKDKLIGWGAGEPNGLEGWDEPEYCAIANGYNHRQNPNKILDISCNRKFSTVCEVCCM